jgi:ATP-binding cassette subfamily B protein
VIRVEGVTFRYPGRLPVFSGLDLEVKGGAITCFAGPSGGGKSTLFGLLQRLYVPTAGRITIDGVDIAHCHAGDLRRIFSAVPQKVEIFSGTLLFNIVVGAGDADLPRVARICEELGLDELIRSLPSGLETHLTESGNNLSGGQRQRIAVARALYRQGKVLLLDEPSASLDAESEALLWQALVRRRASGTAILVASHDQSARAVADVCIRIDARCGPGPESLNPAAFRPDPLGAAVTAAG